MDFSLVNEYPYRDRLMLESIIWPKSSARSSYLRRLNLAIQPSFDSIVETNRQQPVRSIPQLFFRRGNQPIKSQINFNSLFIRVPFNTKPMPKIAKKAAAPQKKIAKKAQKPKVAKKAQKKAAPKKVAAKKAAPKKK